MHSLGMQQICETAGGGSCSYRGAKGQNTIAGRSHGWMVHLLPSSLIRPPGCRLAVASLTTPSQTSLAELTFSAKCCPSSQRDMEPSLRLWQEHFKDPCQWLDGGLNNMPSVDDMFYTAKDVEIFTEHPLQLNFDRLVSSLHRNAEVPSLEKNSEIAGCDHLNSKALMSIDVYPDGWIKDLFENNGAEGESHGCNGIQGFDGGHAIQDPASLRREDPCLEKEPIWSGLLCKPELESSVEMGALKAQMQNGSGSGSWDMLSLEEVLIVLDQCKSGLTSVEDTILTLQKCRKTKSLAYAKSVHLHICSNGLATHKAVENYIVPMFVECGSVSDAQLVFDRLSCRKEHSWTSLILGYSECGQSLHAFYLYRKMQEDNANPSTYTLAAVLKACTRLKDIEKGQEIHIEIAHEGLENDLSVGSSLIGMYSKCGSLSEALEVFDELSSHDVSSWTALIAGYAEHGPYNEALRLFEQMKLEGVTPGMTTYACSLKACNSFGAVDKGHEVHTELAMKGFERDVFVGSALVCMYAKCGSLAEAQEAFDKLPIRDVVSWNSLIAGYVEYGSGQEALGRLEEMKLEGIFPDAVTYASSLKACSSIGAIDKGREIHMEIALIAMEGDSSVFNSLVGMYAKCGSLLEAQGVFDQVPVQDVASWTALIAGYAEYGPAQEALNCFENMQLEGILPDNVMFACSLKACSVIGAINKGREIHMDIARRGFEREPSVGNTLVSMYAKLGSVLEAQKALDKLPVRNVVLWTALIAGYAEYGPFEEASKCLEQMQLEDVAPNSVTFACVLKACGIIRAVSKGWEIHMEIVLKGFETDLLIGNTLIGMYARCGSLLEAQEVFAKLQVRDAVSWNTLISGFVEHGTGQEVLNIFEKMQVEGDCLDAVTFTYILKACGSLGAIDKGREIHMKIRENEFDRESSVGNSLISMYAKCGSLVEAQEVFDKLPVRDVVAWSSMIKAYGINHQGRKAVQYFEDMIEQEVKPDAVTFSCLFLACSHASLVCQGQEYFKVMTEIYGIVPTIEHYTCMIDLLARSGHLYEAENFIMMGCPPLEGTWGSLLSGCKTYGEEELGFRCFQQLVQMNSEVAAWYVLMADIYASAGRWDDVKRVEELRKHAGANKKPASALIEVNKRVHEFVVGNNGNEEVLEMLYSMSLRMKEEGHLPNLDLILKSSTDVRKEAALCEHAERLALAFGLLNTNQGATLRVTKNLRMCNDCHNTSKILSKVERREIILRDDCCIHHFKNGLCSCGDIF